jgi:hypothetical protein
MKLFKIVISTAIFDCYGSVQGHLQFKNRETGVKKFQEILPKNSLVVSKLRVIIITDLHSFYKRKTFWFQWSILY